MKWKRLFFEGEILRLMSFTVLTKPIGLATQMLIARAFGAGVQRDAYNFALYPIQFLGLTTGRIMSAVAIPQIINFRRDHDPKEVDAYQNAIVLVFFVPLVLLMTAFLLWGEIFVDLVGSQLPPETKQYAVKMIRYLSVPGMLLGLVGINQAVLNLNNRYRVAGMMKPLYAAITLVSLIFLTPVMGIWSLVAGFAIARAIQVPWIMIVAYRAGAFRWVRPRIPAGTMSTLWGLSWRIVLTQVFLMVNGFVDRWFGTGLEIGSISSIGYSLTLVNFGEQIFTQSQIVVMFTRMSEYFSTENFVACDRYIRSNLMKATHLIVPGSLCLFVVSPELVRILFQRGAFDEADAIRTSGALGMYLLGLPALVLNGLVTRIFQSLQRLNEKIWLSAQYLLTNVIGNILLVKSLAVVGLAISSSVAINLHLFLSLLVLHYFRNGLRIRSYTAIILSSYLIAAVTWGLYAVTGAGPWVQSLLPGDSVLSTLGVATLKSLILLALYGLLLVAWRRVFRKRTTGN